MEIGGTIDHGLNLYSMNHRMIFLHAIAYTNNLKEYMFFGSKNIHYKVPHLFICMQKDFKIDILHASLGFRNNLLASVCSHN